ncbi:hypothetical protein V2S66_05465 [Streptomyces sp. V4-01]|uniref:Nucleopolyhedrovirus P10 family protein n=1 Tax=Actinacidiphila polyblastidii TaxID=3110430 RepID=A0ABU7P6H5_9ACTN|nr:hypothetical protein [Streptomyces sp. V4-01]
MTRTVRQQVALGRLLPLGRPGDAAWITERAAVALLRQAAARVPGVRLGATSLAAQEGAGEVPSAAPVGALPHVPLLIEADFEASVAQPLPLSAELLRERLWTAARDAVGLTVAAVDLEVTGLLEVDPGASGVEEEPAEPDAPDAPPGPVRSATPAVEAVATAVLAVPGVPRLTDRLTALGGGVRITDDPAVPGGRRVQVQIAVAAGRVPLAVARAAAAAAASAAAAVAPGPLSVAVVVTDAG